MLYLYQGLKECNLPTAHRVYEQTYLKCEQMHREHGFCLKSNGEPVAPMNLYFIDAVIWGKTLIGVIQLSRQERAENIRDFSSRKIDIGEFVRRCEIAKMVEQAAKNHQRKGK